MTTISPMSVDGSLTALSGATGSTTGVVTSVGEVATVLSGDTISTTGSTTG